jgi:hypothetical protein
MSLMKKDSMSLMKKDSMIPIKKIQKLFYIHDYLSINMVGAVGVDRSRPGNRYCKGR